MGYEIETRDVTTPGGIPSYAARPVAAGPFPSFVVLHERYGLVEHTRDLADRIAAEGYCVLAPNLYYDFPDQEGLRLGTATCRIDDHKAIEVLEEAVSLFPKIENADAGRLGMLGACATGRHPVLWGADHSLQSCVVLHGLYREREWPADGVLHFEPMRDLVARMRAPFLGLFGELDHSVSADDVRFIRDQFEELDKAYRIRFYAGAPHGWMNSTMPGRYRPVITELSWRELSSFLRETLQTSVVRDPELVTFDFRLAKHVDYDFAKNVRMG